MGRNHRLMFVEKLQSRQYCNAAARAGCSATCVELSIKGHMCVYVQHDQRLVSDVETCVSCESRLWSCRYECVQEKISSSCLDLTLRL
jgi:hypothetical protein